MKKNFFIFLTILLAPLQTLYCQEQKKTSYLDVGFKVNLPYVFMNYAIYEADVYGRPDVGHRCKSHHFGVDLFGLHLTLNYNFSRDLSLEGRAGLALRDAPIELNFETGFNLNYGLVLKKFIGGRNFYGAISFESGDYIPSVNPNFYWDRILLQPSKNLIGIGFGVRIWRNLFYEILFHRTLGNMTIFEERENQLYGTPPYESRNTKLLFFVRTSLGYSFEVLKRQ
ncbi:MAG: hypothetical protein RMJ81_00300 [Candidatus Kryptonium sp.]|nr:hypothetical protein [Candidatus Kryptonium sp.]